MWTASENTGAEVFQQTKILGARRKRDEDRNIKKAGGVSPVRLVIFSLF